MNALPFDLPPAPVAVAIFAAVYVLIVADRFDRSLIAMIGAGALVLLGVLDQDEAVRGIDFNTLALLAGMMVLVGYIQRTGAFEAAAIAAARLARGSPAAMLCLLALATALISTALNNVTTMMLVAPVTLALTRRYALPAMPFLLAETMASNIGGAATLIGDPPNMMIGSAAGLSFDDFLTQVAPAVVMVMAVQTLAAHLVWGRRLRIDVAAPDLPRPASAITDARLLRQSLVVLALALAAFVGGGRLAGEAGTIALTAAVVLVLIDNLSHHRHQQTARVTAAYGEIDWITLVFFTGLFVMAHALETTGVLARLAGGLLAVTHGQRAATTFALLWGSAALSALFDNIPLVAVAIPLIRSLAPTMGGPDALLPAWWALSLGASLGGNGTLLGASANLTVAGIARRHEVPFGFAAYTWRAAPLTLLSLAICHLYLWLRFF